MIFRNYDPGLVVFSWKGILVLGYASGSMIDVERASDAFSMDVGSHGDVTRVRSRDRTGSITVRLQAASPTNDLLSAQALVDEDVGSAEGPAMLKDLNDTTIAEAAHAWIRKFPVISKADEATVREWVFDCADLRLFVGGALS